MNFSDPTHQELNPANNSKKRELLFTFQSIIVTGLLALTAIAFFFYNDLAIVKGIKVIFAPFLSVSYNFV